MLYVCEDVKSNRNGRYLSFFASFYSQFVGPAFQPVGRSSCISAGRLLELS